MSIIKPPQMQKEEKGGSGNGCCKGPKTLAGQLRKIVPASGSEPIILAPPVKSGGKKEHCGKCDSTDDLIATGDAGAIMEMKEALDKEGDGPKKTKTQPIRFMPNLPGDFNEYPPVELPEKDDDLVGTSMGMHDSNPLLTKKEYLNSQKDSS